MVFANFIKQARFKYHNPHYNFFQSTYRRFHFYDGLTEYCHFFNSKWYSNHRYAKSKLAISNGHYGVYYTMYNHDEKQNGGVMNMDNYLLASFLLNTSLMLTLSNYLINYYYNLIPKFDLKFDVTADLFQYPTKVNNSKVFKRYFLSSPKSYFKGPVKIINEERFEDPLKRVEARPEEVDQIYENELKIVEMKEKLVDETKEKVVDETKVEVIDQIVVDEAKVKVFDRIVQNENVVVDKVLDENAMDVPDLEEDFDPIDISTDKSFLNNQVNLINTLFAKEEYLRIYSIYQTLKRNNVKVSIDVYNTVLISLVNRSTDTGLSLKDLLQSYETKLTDLLTVYQDLLSNSCKPNYVTYNLILESLLSASLRISDLNTSSNSLLSRESSLSSSNFAQIGLEIFNSIQNFTDLHLTKILPLITKTLVNQPHLIKQDLLSKVLLINQDPISQELHTFEPNFQSSTENLISLIALSKHFAAYPSLFNTAKEKYQFIVSIYNKYKQLYINNGAGSIAEFEVYSPLLESLIQNGFVNLASKFLDDILVDYKSVLRSSMKPTKLQMSNLISSYVIAIANQSNPEATEQAFSLSTKFNKVQYLPELSVELYDNLIKNFVHECYDMMNEKAKLGLSNDSAQLNLIFNKQAAVLERAWILYDHLAVRQDYQSTHSSSKINCREALLSLSIELGDHDRIFHLVKEILASKHMIFDIYVFKQLLSYLYNGVVYESNFNFQYYGLIWSLVESQYAHYKHENSSNFISEVINYLIICPSEDFVEINCQHLMNSSIINNVINTFNFQKDNLYGISMASNFLMQYNGGNIELMNQIIAYQAKLINKFEDTENHYFKLNRELLSLKEMLRPYFAAVIENFKDSILYSPDVLHACKGYDISVPENVTVDPRTLQFEHENDLTYLLNIEYESGVSEFLSLFENKMNFNQKTWELIFNHNFVHDHMMDLRFPVNDFIDRMFEAKFDIDAKLKLLSTLVSIDCEIVSIAVVKFLIKNPTILAEYPTTALVELFKVVTDSPNRYLKKLTYDPPALLFNTIFEHNKNLSWVAEYLKLLSKENQPMLIINLVSQHGFFDNITTKFSETLVLILTRYLWALSKTDNPHFTKEFMKLYIDNTENKQHLQSLALIEVLMQYYLSRDELKPITSVLTKFTTFFGKTQTITEGLLQASFLTSMNQGSFKSIFPMTKANSLRELSLQLLCCVDIATMKEVIDMNRFTISNNLEDFISSIFQTLTEMSKSKLVNKDQIDERFQFIMKGLNLMRVRDLSTRNLTDIITYLFSNDCKETLNILVQKLINNDKFTNVLNFYFMKTTFNNDIEKSQISNILYKACQYVNDKINAMNISTFTQANNISLNLD